MSAVELDGEKLLPDSAPQDIFSCAYNYRNNMLLQGTNQAGYIFTLDLKLETATQLDKQISAEDLTEDMYKA